MLVAYRCTNLNVPSGEGAMPERIRVNVFYGSGACTLLYIPQRCSVPGLVTSDPPSGLENGMCSLAHTPLSHGAAELYAEVTRPKGQNVKLTLKTERVAPPELKSILNCIIKHNCFLNMSSEGSA